MKKLSKCPNEITIVYVQAVLMPQGELITKGKTIGWFKNFKEHVWVD